MKTEKERNADEERESVSEGHRQMEAERERGFPWDVLGSVVCWGVAGTMLWVPRGARVEDVQNVMDPPTAEEPLGSRAEIRCGRVGQRDMEGCL